MINVRVAASSLRIAEVCSFEENRLHGVSNLNAVRDGFRVLKTIRQEFLALRQKGRADRRYRALHPQRLIALDVPESTDRVS